MKTRGDDSARAPDLLATALLCGVRAYGERCPACRGAGDAPMTEDVDGGERAAPILWLDDAREVCPTCSGSGVFPIWWYEEE